MNSLFSNLKDLRRQRQLTQHQLAIRAGTSLATIQNIEAGRANPEWATIEALCQALDVQLVFESNTFTWEKLISFGCPLMSGPTHQTSDTPKPTKQRLLNLLTIFSSETRAFGSETREAKAFYAFLSAIKDHFPSVWPEVDSKLKSWFAHYRGAKSNKLRRIALSQLSEYL